MMLTNSFDFTRKILENVSFDPKLFCKELNKAVQLLLPYELEQLHEWVLKFTASKPELKQCLVYLR
ncbi:hypothetical protein FLBR109950_08380 [Flavobacterium branchiophilum]|uniref:Uncharacterized protein n=3 Tax=Flavobacterium branchiophilum TaxID=55197 RepID=G2Z2W0_FLABF|nr:hypothetical protein B0A77_10195 [Flavobacterium branchiophilum]CCB70289.1 Protein of unknown function [Flavobacterium branchiophilum FL-15]